MYEANDMIVAGGYENCRRERLRVSCLAAVEIKTASGNVVKGNLRDICLEGMYVKIEKILKTWPQPGDLAHSALSITQGKSKLTINMPGKVVRCDEDGFAIIFAEKLKWWPVFIIFPINDRFLFDVVAEL